MKLHRWAQEPVETMNAAVKRQALHAATMTVARIYVSQGGEVPEHSHPNEQISTVLEGRLLFFSGGERIEAAAGESVVIPPGAPHRVVAVEDSVALDVFSPPREDWIRGDDAYFRR